MISGSKSRLIRVIQSSWEKASVQTKPKKNTYKHAKQTNKQANRTHTGRRPTSQAQQAKFQTKKNNLATSARSETGRSPPAEGGKNTQICSFASNAYFVLLRLYTVCVMKTEWVFSLIWSSVSVCYLIIGYWKRCSTKKPVCNHNHRLHGLCTGRQTGETWFRARWQTHPRTPQELVAHSHSTHARGWCRVPIQACLCWCKLTVFLCKRHFFIFFLCLYIFIATNKIERRKRVNAYHCSSVVCLPLTVHF